MRGATLAPPIGTLGDADPAQREKRWTRDALALGSFLIAAVFVTLPLWMAPGERVAPMYQSDPALMQWYLAHATRAVMQLENPLLTTMANVPHGVNLMANTAILGLAVPLVPVTLVFGPAVSLLILLTLGPAATATGWYLLLSRHVVRSTFAAAVGGFVCGFAPPLISHLNWHPNIAFQLLVPLIVWRVLKLRDPGRVWRNGIILGLLVTYQAFINEEILLSTALACGLLLTVLAVQHPQAVRDAWRPLLASLGVTALVAGSLLAYPLWVQFFGPNHYRGLIFQHMSVDLASFSVFATESVAGSGRFVKLPLLAPNHAEENAFFGWPLLLLAVVAVWLLRRSATARALTDTALVFALLSLGREVMYRGRPTGIPGPWAAFGGLPLLEAALPTRFGLVVAAILGVLIALATQHVWDLAARRSLHSRRRLCLLWTGVLCCALIPSSPTPLEVVAQPPVPKFIVDGGWRNHVGAGQTLVPVPFPTPYEAVGIRWAAAAKVGFAIPGGYFVLPDGGIDGQTGVHYVSPRPTAQLLITVGATGQAQPITRASRRAAEADFRHWRAAIVVLAVADPQAEPFRQTLEDLLGPAQRANDVWIWDLGRAAGVEGGG